MHMGANGFLWMRWGAGGARSTKTRQAGGIYGRADQDLGAMAGEISPDMMFWEVRQKASRMGVDGYRLIRVGANGRRGKEGSKNEAKRSTNGRAGHILRRMQTVKETSKSRAMVMELGEGHWQDFRDVKVWTVRNGYVCERKGGEGTNNGAKKTKTSKRKYALPADLHSKNSKYETTQNKHQEKLSQNITRIKQQSRTNERSVQATKTKIRVQEVTQIEKTPSARTCRKARNANVSNMVRKKQLSRA